MLATAPPPSACREGLKAPPSACREAAKAPPTESPSRPGACARPKSSTAARRKPLMTSAAGPPGAMTQPGAETPFRHQPVLLAEVLSFVPPHARLAVDCTVGGAGHARALLERFPDLSLLACDRDPAALAAARSALASCGPRVLVKHAAFSDVPHHVLMGSVDFLLADLGLSSPQVDEAARGFSFTHDGPLDMRMDPSRSGRTAAHLVNSARPEELLRVLRELGEERFAARIVRAIEAERAVSPVETTGRLARIVAGAVPKRFHRAGFHPATQTFQALRMAVNDELGQLERLLDAIPDLLAPGGRAAIIAFHSLEDRRVKDAFRTWEEPCVCPPEAPRCVCGRIPLGRRVTRKPVVADTEEVRRNPRARSAKLRVFEKAIPEATTVPGGGSRVQVERQQHLRNPEPET
jgi:16S rRNA (cytosine1402-N4)-methyltransferase